MGVEDAARVAFAFTDEFIFARFRILDTASREYAFLDKEIYDPVTCYRTGISGYFHGGFELGSVRQFGSTGGKRAGFDPRGGGCGAEVARPHPRSFRGSYCVPVILVQPPFLGKEKEPRLPVFVSNPSFLFIHYGYDVFPHHIRGHGIEIRPVPFNDVDYGGTL